MKEVVGRFCGALTESRRIFGTVMVENNVICFFKPTKRREAAIITGETGTVPPLPRLSAALSGHTHMDYKSGQRL